MNEHYRIAVGARSETGCVRTHNEDSLCSRDEGLWAVADGMGGHEHGQWASRTIADALDFADLGGGFTEGWQAAAAAIHTANAGIWQEAASRGTQMGSTVVALHARDGKFAVLWVGDSRAYHLHDGRLDQLTTDHTRVHELVERGLLAPDAVHDHPMRHILSRAVGVGPDIEIETRAGEFASGDRFLLCSDGLTSVVSDDEIAKLAELSDEAEAVSALIDLTMLRGAPDNVSVILVGISEITQLSFGPPPESLAT